MFFLPQKRFNGKEKKNYSEFFLTFYYIIEKLVSVKSLQSDICRNFFPSKIFKFKPTTTLKMLIITCDICHISSFSAEKMCIRRCSIYFIYEIFAGFFGIFYMIINTSSVPVYSCFRWEVNIVKLSSCAGILEKYMGARLHRQAELILGVL